MRKIRFQDILHPAMFFSCFYIFFIGFSALYHWVFLPDFNIETVTYFIILLYITVFLLSSNFFTPLLLSYKPRKIKFIHPKKNIKKTSVLGIILVFFGALFHLYYYFSIGFLPIFHDEVANVRVTAKQGFGGVVLLGGGAIYAGMIMLSSCFMSYGKIGKVATFLILGASVFIISGVGFRGPAAYLALVFFLNIYFTSNDYLRKNKISHKHVVLGFVFVLFLSILDRLRHGYGLSVDGVLQILWAMTVNFYNLIDIVAGMEKGDIDYYYGSSIINDFFAALPLLDGQFLGVELKVLLQKEFSGDGMTVTAPGEGFVNGGWVGVVFHAFLLGALSEIIYKIFTDKGTVNSIMILVFLSVSIARMSVSGLMPMIVFFVVPVFIFLMPALWICRE